MLVALLVGALRTAAESDSDPSFILAALNRRLLGRGDARATCLALRIECDGTVWVASDGVAEATNENGELFGFDRALELVRARPSAARIAEVAQAFGQGDDISVISVTRMPVAEPAMG
jgi:stage II sporulation SpoE-like protein